MQTLTISTLNTDDKSAVFDLLQNPEVMRFLGPRRALTDEEAYDWFSEALNTPSRLVFRLDDDLVGFCGVKIVEGKQDFGYFLRQKYWRQGLAKTMCKMALSELEKNKINLTELDVFIADNNFASLKIANALGWRKNRTMKNAFEHGGIYKIQTK